MADGPTGHLQIVEALRESERRFRAIFDSTFQFIGLMAPDGTLLEANKTALDFIGVTRDDVLGRPFWDTPWWSHSAALQEQLREAVNEAANGKLVRFEACHPIGSGRSIAIDFSLKPCFDDTGNVVFLIPEGRDITERRNLVEALKEADRQKDQFLAMLGHELRNMLGPMQNAAHILNLVGGDSEDLQHAVATIDRRVEQMARLVDDLLDVSRIGSGKILLKKEHHDLTCMVRQMGQDYRNVVEAKGVVLDVQTPDEPLFVLGDSTRLVQIVGNLLHNSAKFTDKGGNIKIELTREPDGKNALIRIRDTGVGIAPELLQQVFEPFTQTHQEFRAGLGLGLALVKGLTELHGGEVQALSDGPGLGSEFRIRLPLETSKTPQSNAGPRQTAERMYRILIIDDNQDQAVSLRKLLMLRGHEAEVAFTGAEGVEAARRFRPNVILCDIGLPGGMDGYAVARTLRGETSMSSVHLVALTGFGNEEDQRRSQESGFHLHLVKPLRVDKVLRALADLHG